MTFRLTRVPRRAPCLVLPLALLACSPGDASDAPAGLRRSPSMLVKPNPVSVRATVDTTMEIDEYIEAAKGGQVVTFDQERGLMYELTIPPNALLANQRITIAPVTAIDGLPLSGGMTGAVRLEPDGLQLAAPARLRIMKFDVAEGRIDRIEGSHIGFAAESDGDELRLHVASASDSGIVIHLTHFTIEGSAEGTVGDIAAQAARAPSSPDAQYEQRMAAAFERERARSGSDKASVSKADEVALFNEILEIERARYWDVIRPKLVAAADSKDALLAGYAAFYAWRRGIQLVGDEDEEHIADLVEDGTALLEKALDANYDRAVDRCRKAVDLGAVGLMLQIRQIAQTIGLHGETERFPKMWDEIEACTAVDVAFESKIDFFWGDGVTESHDVVRAQVPLEFDLLEGSFSGRGPLHYVSASGVVNGFFGGGAGAFIGGCMLRVLGPSRPGEFEVLGLFLATNAKTDPKAALGDSISLMIDPGTPMHRYRAEQCKGLGTASQATVTESEGWRPSWEDQHRAEQLQRPDSLALRQAAGESDTEAPLAWVIGKFEPGAGAVIARRSFDTTMRNQLARVVERTTIELRRRPRN